MSDVTEQSVAAPSSGSSAKRRHLAASELPAAVREALDGLVRAGGVILAYELTAVAIAGIGENSYGLLVQLQATPTRTLPTFAPVQPVHAIVKIAPSNAARRSHMKVANYYAREVFMYQQVLSAYEQLQKARSAESDEQLSRLFAVAPRMLHASLEPCEEFIILEDLCQRGFAQNERSQLPTYELAASALCALAQLHAMSFVLQAQQPQRFAAFVAQLDDNLFTEQVEPVTIEFAQKYIREARHLLRPQETEHYEQLVPLLTDIEQHYKRICLRCVNGAACAPYAVICHGDFWNNNILYKENPQQLPTAKLVDFQMSRYASPVLDVMHYFFACTTKQLRDAHLPQLLQLYYDTLTQHIGWFGLQPAAVYPRPVFDQQLREYGVFGFCMAAMAIPFFISLDTELPDLDEVSEAIVELGNTAENSAAAEPTAKSNCRELVDAYNLITPRNLPIFKERMCGIAEDLLKYSLMT